MPRAVCDSIKEPKTRNTKFSKRYTLNSVIMRRLPKSLYWIRLRLYTRGRNRSWLASGIARNLSRGY